MQFLKSTLKTLNGCGGGGTLNASLGKKTQQHKGKTKIFTSLIYKEFLQINKTKIYNPVLVRAWNNRQTHISLVRI